MHTGRVKWFSKVKGIGFIVPDPKGLPTGMGDDEVFVHYSDITGEGRRNLDEGAKVLFNLTPNGLHKNGRQRYKATSVRMISY